MTDQDPTTVDGVIARTVTVDDAVVIAALVAERDAFKNALAQSRANEAMLREALERIDRESAWKESTVGGLGRIAHLALDSTDDTADLILAALRAADDYVWGITAGDEALDRLTDATKALRERGILPKDPS